MEHHGKLLHKLVKRKKLTQVQASGLLGFSREKLNRLFNREVIDEITREEIEKVFELPASYFINTPELPQSVLSPPVEASCWQLLAEARQHIIQLQQQLIEMSRPNLNAPVGKQAV